MSAGAADSRGASLDLAARRLALDLDDLRFENARLKTSIAERQAEIEALSARLGLLQAQLERLHRISTWSSMLFKPKALRMLLRRR